MLEESKVMLFAASAGVGSGLLGWLLFRSFTAIPNDNRDFLDKPPMAFRLAAFPVRWVQMLIAPLVTNNARARVLNRLKLAGQDYRLLPDQFLAGQCLLGGLLAGAGFGLAGLYLLPQLPLLLAGAIAGWLYPLIWLSDLIKIRKKQLLRALPFYLDLITLCVEAGLNLQGAMAQAVARGPVGPFRDELKRILRDIRAGKSRMDALNEFAERVREPAIRNLVNTLIQAEKMGLNLGPVLRAQAEQRRSERFLRAEKLAMEAPVRMLFPLLFFIMPCAMAVILFPIVVKIIESGFF